ncbi:MAG: Hpt domain-containing protein [Bacteroidota bacterium]
MIDLNRLQNLLGGNPDNVKRFIQIYKTQMPVSLKQIEDGITEGNLETVSLAAHDIKSQSRYLGLKVVAKTAADLEEKADSGQSEKTLLLLFGKLTNQLNTILPTL